MKGGYLNNVRVIDEMFGIPFKLSWFSASLYFFIFTLFSFFPSLGRWVTFRGGSPVRPCPVTQWSGAAARTRTLTQTLSHEHKSNTLFSRRSSLTVPASHRGASGPDNASLCPTDEVRGYSQNLAQVSSHFQPMGSHGGNNVGWGCNSHTRNVLHVHWLKKYRHRVACYMSACG